MFGKSDQHRVKVMLASVLDAIISQRLVRTTNNTRRPAVEVLINNARIKEIITEGKSDDIYTAIAESKNTYGMQTFDQHLLELYESDTISAAEALEKATKRSDLEIKIKNVNLAREESAQAQNSKNPFAKSIQRDVIALKEID